jgi:hypothetical protein
MLTKKELEHLTTRLIIYEDIHGLRWMCEHQHPLLLSEIRPLNQEEQQQVVSDIQRYFTDCEFSFEEAESPRTHQKYSLLVMK